MNYLSITNSTRCVGSGDTWVDYMLSGILAGHGCSIRDVELSTVHKENILTVRFFENSGGRRGALRVLYVEPVSDVITDRSGGPIRFTDAVLRFYFEGEVMLPLPRWHTVLLLDTFDASYKEFSFSLLGK